MKLSIVTTLYQSEPYIKEFYRRLILAVKKITDDYEIIFVNDGSPDLSIEICKNLAAKDKSIKIINLSRNFGHHKAMMTGLNFVTGANIFLIDCDLEEPPEVIEDFYSKLLSDAADVVYGTQKKRNGSLINKFIGKIYYKLFQFFTGIKITPNICTVRLMSKRYVDALISYKEKELIIGGVWYLVGFKQVAFPILKLSKEKSSYNFLKRLSCFFDSIISFSFKPLIYFCSVGFVIFFSSFFYTFIIFLKKIFGSSSIDGWTSLMMSIWVLGGVTISFLGVISLYLAKIFIEVKARPLTIVKEVFDCNSSID